MASLRKALKDALPNKRITVMEGKENRAYVETPHSKRTHWANTRTALSEKPPSRQSDESAQFKRNNKLTLSVRDVVGSFRQKLKRSTRQRKRLQDAQSPVTQASRFKKNDKGKKTPTRKGGYREVKMYSPFGIETPPRKRTPVGIRTRPMWHDVETPTRLRKEVEDLTANMQALINLTPQTLKSRSVSRRSLPMASPLTNGSLKTPKEQRRVAGKTLQRRNVRTTEI